MKEPGTSQNGDRFGTFVKRIRQKDPREITSIRLADYLGIADCLGVQEAWKEEKRSSPKQIIQEANHKILGSESLHVGRIGV